MDVLCDKVQKIVDTFNLLSLENQSILLECACNTLKAEKSVKKSVTCTPKYEERISEKNHGGTGLTE